MRLLLSILLVLLLVPSWTGDPRLPLLDLPLRFRVEAVLLDPADPARRRVGALRYIGGVRLSSRDPAFGGFSAMAVDGDRLTLLSDGGGILRFRIDAAFHVTDARAGELPAGPGTGWRKEDRDSESLTLDPRTGRLWAGFEGWNQIWRYAPGFRAATGHAAPPAMRRWPGNTGAEAMTRLRDGRFVAIAEGDRRPGSPERPAFVFAGDPVERPSAGFGFRYVPPAGYDPSDMTELPDGRLLVLNRRVAWPDGFSAKLVVIARSALRPGAAVRGREIATIAKPLTRDNFEAVAAVREGGRTIVWLASDDNQLPIESSFLMKFALDER